MSETWREMVWGQQLGPSIAMLENAILACPDAVWAAAGETPAWKERDVVGFRYLAYHAVFWLDHNLTQPPSAMVPPAPFGLEELDPAGLLPEQPYTKDEILGYVTQCREKCRSTIFAMSDDAAREPCGLERLAISRAELLLYSMRHVQHHTAQLQLLMRQRTGGSPRWVPQAADAWNASAGDRASHPGAL